MPSLLRNDKKCKSIFIFYDINLSWQGLKMQNNSIFQTIYLLCSISDTAITSGVILNCHQTTTIMITSSLMLCCALWLTPDISDKIGSPMMEEFQSEITICTSIQWAESVIGCFLGVNRASIESTESKPVMVYIVSRFRKQLVDWEGELLMCSENFVCVCSTKKLRNKTSN